MSKPKLIRITTVPISLNLLLKNQLQYMKNEYEVIAVSSDATQLKEVAQAQGVSTFAISLTRKITPFTDLKAIWQLYFFLKKEKPHIVHSHTPKAGLVAMVAAYLARVPHRLHTVAGLPLLEKKGLKRKILNQVERLTYCLATDVFPNSFGLKEIIVDLGFCKKRKLTVIGNGSSNGIDTTAFNPENFSTQQKQTLKATLNISQDDFIFLFVGRLVADKGISELIIAFEEYIKQNKKIKLLLVGDYEIDLDGLPKSVMNAIRNNSSIIFTGMIDDVKPYYSISDCLVFPSYREGFPNVVMEAGAMGLPAIVTNINGCNEIISDGKNGIIIPVKDAVAVFKAMKKMAEDVPYYNQLKQNTRAMIVSRYEQKKVWEAILKRYQALQKKN